MRKFMLFPALAIVLGICLQIGACAGTSTKNTPQQNALAVIGDVKTAASQAAGASAAITNLTASTPVISSATASQINGYVAWANFALQAVAIATQVAGAAL